MKDKYELRQKRLSIPPILLLKYFYKLKKCLNFAL